ncbi:MAG: gliding motility-associated C-terminal domain-containing protein [Taibaiella sp.]|jgi:gliding motility-associated-like protein
MKRFNLFLILICSLFLGIKSTNAQIALQYTDTTLCPGQTIEMCASLTGQSDDNTSDDYYGNVLDIGFPFVFFGKTYTKCIASGNGMIRFDTTKANQPVGWQWGQITGSGDANNAIFATFLDLFLPAGGKIRYQRTGNVGTRRFIVEWCSLPVYGCNSLIVTSQAILYEGTNEIEIHTTKIPPITGNCPSASFGYYGQVVQGVRNEIGTFEYFPTDRGPVTSPTNWGLAGINNDGMRFTPTSGTVYTTSPIPFNPWVIIDSLSSLDLKWHAEGQPNLPIGTGPCVTATPDGQIDYYTVSFNGNAGCENDLVSFIDTVFIHYGTSYDTTQMEICAGTTYHWFDRDLFKAGNYDTLLKTVMGCDSFLRLQLIVNPLPNIALKNFSSTIGLCGSDSVVLSILNPESTTTYQWYKDGSPIALNGQTFKYTVKQAGVYTVTATTNKGCTLTSQKVTVTANPSPVAAIIPIPETVICAYDTLEIAAVAGAGYDYRWTPEKPFRVISGPDGQKVKGVFLDPITTVTLTVYNQYGCYDSATTLVLTKPCCEVFIPNAFSPNGDGLNEYFNPQLQLGQILLTMQVFDRYGKLIYNNTNIKKGWDGKYEDGAEASTGVYMYFIKYTCADGKLYEKKESVSLIR